jgi:hypothetical protein
MKNYQGAIDAFAKCNSQLEFLPEVWPNVKRQMETIFQDFDTDGSIYSVLIQAYRSIYFVNVSQLKLPSIYVPFREGSSWMNDEGSTTGSIQVPPKAHTTTLELLFKAMQNPKAKDQKETLRKLRSILSWYHKTNIPCQKQSALSSILSVSTSSLPSNEPSESPTMKNSDAPSSAPSASPVPMTVNATSSPESQLPTEVASNPPTGDISDTPSSRPSSATAAPSPVPTTLNATLSPSSQQSPLPSNKLSESLYATLDTDNPTAASQELEGAAAAKPSSTLKVYATLDTDNPTVASQELEGAAAAKSSSNGTDIMETTTDFADKATTDFADKDSSLRIIRWIDILIERDKIFCAQLRYFSCTVQAILCTVPVHLLVLHTHFTLSPLFSFSTFYVYLRLAHRVQ